MTNRDTVVVLCQALLFANSTIPAAAQRGSAIVPADSVQALLRLAGDTTQVTRDERAAIARIKLAIRESPIRASLPNLRCCVSSSSRTSETYRSRVLGTTATVSAETVTIKLLWNDVPFVEASWAAELPDSTTERYFPAQVRAEDLLTTLLMVTTLTQDDLAQLARSRIPELRIAVVAKSTDLALLARLAEDRVGAVSLAALRKRNEVEAPAKAEAAKARLTTVTQMTDQAALARAAIEDIDSGVRAAAVEKITDLPVLAKVAIGDTDSRVRKAAVEKIADQAVLAKVVIGDKDSRVRAAAVERIMDQDVLAKVAIGDTDLGVGRAAISKVTDQALLAKVAVEGHDWMLCESAVEKLTDQGAPAKVATSLNFHAKA